MKRFLTSIALTAGASLAVHLYQKRQSPVDFARETIDYVKAKKEAWTDVNRQQANVKKRVVKLEQELAKAQPVIDDITKSVDQFQFKIQPHLDKINAHLARVNQSTSGD